MYVVFHSNSNFAAYIVCRRYKPCEFFGFVWTDCWGNKSNVITSPANSMLICIFYLFLKQNNKHLFFSLLLQMFVWTYWKKNIRWYSTSITNEYPLEFDMFDVEYKRISVGIRRRIISLKHNDTVIAKPRWCKLYFKEVIIRVLVMGKLSTPNPYNWQTRLQTH